MAYYARCTLCPATFNDKSRAEAHGTGHTVTLWQIRMAWEKTFGKPIPGDIRYDVLYNQVRAEIGCDEAMTLALSFTNPNL